DDTTAHIRTQSLDAVSGKQARRTRLEWAALSCLDFAIWVDDGACPVNSAGRSGFWASCLASGYLSMCVVEVFHHNGAPKSEELFEHVNRPVSTNLARLVPTASSLFRKEYFDQPFRSAGTSESRGRLGLD